MKTDVSASPSPTGSGIVAEPSTEERGFLTSIVKSVFEPGVNPSVVMAMNVSFFLLIITLFGLAFLTDWNKHVIILMLVSCGFWMTMIWFVMEVSKVQTSKQNTPIVPEGTPDISGGSSAESVRAAGVEPKKDR